MTEGRRLDAWLFIGAFALRLLWILDLSRLPFFDLPTSDSLFYARRAAEIAAGGIVGSELAYPSSPLYPYLVAPFFLVAGRASWWGLYLAQAALDAASAVLLRRAGSILFGPFAGWIAGIAWAGYGLAVFFTGDLMEATAAAFFANLFMYLIVSGQARRLAAAGAALGLACLMRPHFLPIALLTSAALPLVLLRASSFSRSIATLTFVVGLAIPLGLSVARNYAASGEVVLVSPYSGLNAYLGNHREAAGTLRFPSGKGLRNDVDLRRAAHAYPESKTGRALSEREVSSFWWRETRAEIAADPLAWAGLMLKKLRLFWSSREAPNHLDFYFFREASVPLSIAAVPFGLLGPLALAGCLLIVGRSVATGASLIPGAPASRGPLFLAVPTLGYSLVASIFFIGDRFRLPATGWITLAAAGTLTWIASWLRAGRRREATALLAALAILGAALHEPAAGPRGAREHVLVAAALEGRGRLEEAERLYRRAVDLEPGSAVARFNLGRHLARTGRHLEASTEAERAARLAPGFAPAHALLGDLSLRLDPPSPSEARLRYEEAIRIEPYGPDADRLRIALATLDGIQPP